MSEELEQIKVLLEQTEKMYQKGQSFIDNIEKLLQSEQAQKISEQELKALQVSERVLSRRYSVQEAAKLTGISTTSIYQAEKQGKLTKRGYRQDTQAKRQLGFTVNGLNEIRKAFGRENRKPKDKQAAIVGFLNLKGGAWKTSLTWLFSQYLALRGYRILMVDTDPQGSLSFNMGFRPDIDVDYEHTIAPYMLGDQEALEEAGFGENAHQSLRYAIQKTYWGNIDLIPSCLQTLTVDLELPALMKEHAKAAAEAGMSTGLHHLELLRRGLIDIEDDYDFIIVDGTPSLNISTMNVVSACDITVVPTPAQMVDFSSTLQFTQLVSTTLSSYLNYGLAPATPLLRFCITKFSDSAYAEWMGQIIRKTFNNGKVNVYTSEAHHSDEIGKSNNRITSIYEVQPSETNNPRRLKKTIEQYDQLFDEILADIKTEVWGIDDPNGGAKGKSVSVGELLREEGVI